VTIIFQNPCAEIEIYNEEIALRFSNVSETNPKVVNQHLLYIRSETNPKVVDLPQTNPDCRGSTFTSDLTQTPVVVDLQCTFTSDLTQTQKAVALHLLIVSEINSKVMNLHLHQI
jgi:hypothetical protein